MDKLNFETFLEMKWYVENKKPGYSWRIGNMSCGNGFYLDDGNQSYFKFEFNKDDYSKEQVIRLARQLAKELNIDCTCYTDYKTEQLI